MWALMRNAEGARSGVAARSALVLASEGTREPPSPGSAESGSG